MIGQSRPHVQYLFFIGRPRVIPLVYRMRSIRPNSAGLRGQPSTDLTGRFPYISMRSTLRPHRLRSAQCIVHTSLELGIPTHLITFQVMRRSLATNLQGHGTLKDTQGALRHASITTTGNVYVQIVEDIVILAVNSHASTALEGWSRSDEDGTYGAKPETFAKEDARYRSDLVKFGEV
jgi:hypothetical protein